MVALFGISMAFMIVWCAMQRSKIRCLKIELDAVRYEHKRALDDNRSKSRQIVMLLEKSGASNRGGESDGPA
jgi:hypothetical protein